MQDEQKNQPSQSIKITGEAFEALKAFCGSDKKIGPTASKLILAGISQQTAMVPVPWPPSDQKS